MRLQDTQSTLGGSARASRAAPPNPLALALLGGSLLAAGAAACGARSSFIDPLALGEGGAGGSTGPGNTSSTTTTTTTTTTTSTNTVTSTGTGTTADCDQLTNTCDECQACAVQSGGPCELEYVTCNSNIECVDLLNCVQDCQTFCANDPDPEGCFDICTFGPTGCTGIFPGGVDDLEALLECVFAWQCSLECG
jgi:hypothetical protein